MELTLNVKVRPRIVPHVNSIYTLFGRIVTNEERNLCGKKFLTINRDKFRCYMLDTLDFKDEAQNIVEAAFDSENVDIASAKVTLFQYSWINQELQFTFRISFYANDDSNVGVRKDELQQYVLEWMQEEGAYIGLGENEYWGENGVMCSFRVEIEESDVDVIAFTSEE